MSGPPPLLRAVRALGSPAHASGDCLAVVRLLLAQGADPNVFDEGLGVPALVLAENLARTSGSAGAAQASGVAKALKAAGAVDYRALVPSCEVARRVARETDARTRMYAIGVLGNRACREVSLEGLTARLGDREEANQALAAYFLSHLGPAAAPAVPDLRKLVDSPGTGPRAALSAARALVAADPRAAPSVGGALVRALDAPDAWHVGAALEDLTRFGLAHAVPVERVRALARQPTTREAAVSFLRSNAPTLGLQLPLRSPAARGDAGRDRITSSPCHLVFPGVPFHPATASSPPRLEETPSVLLLSCTSEECVPSPPAERLTFLSRSSASVGHFTGKTWLLPDDEVAAGTPYGSYRLDAVLAEPPRIALDPAMGRFKVLAVSPVPAPSVEPALRALFARHARARGATHGYGLTAMDGGTWVTEFAGAEGEPGVPRAALASCTAQVLGRFAVLRCAEAPTLVVAGDAVWSRNDSSDFTTAFVERDGEPGLMLEEALDACSAEHWMQLVLTAPDGGVENLRCPDFQILPDGTPR